MLGIIIPILREGRLRPSEVQGLDQGSLEARLEYVTPCWAVPGRLVGPRSGQALYHLLTGMAAEPGGSIESPPAGESWGGGWGCTSEPGHLSWEQELSSSFAHSQKFSHLVCLSVSMQGLGVREGKVCGLLTLTPPLGILVKSQSRCALQYKERGS